MTLTQNAHDLAREGLYRFFAGVLSDPRTARYALMREQMQLEWLRAATELLRDEAAPTELGFGEQPPEELQVEDAWTFLSLERHHRMAEYERVFGLMSCRECPPYETEYQPNNEPFFRSQQMADVAGFYNAFGLVTPPNCSERPDHLPLQLEFMAFLLMKTRLARLSDDQANWHEQAEICEEAARKFFAEHLAWWVPSFTRGLRHKAGDGLFTELADALAAFITLERQRYGLPSAKLPVRPEADTEPEEEGCAGCSLKGQ